MSEVNPEAGKIRFTRRREPPIVAGDYEITVTQDLSASHGGKELFAESFGDTRYIAVGGERFTLDPGEVAAVFPPDNNRGEYHDMLPHVVLSRRTLPWERSIDQQADGISWLAVLLFEDDEAPALRSCMVGDLQRADFATNADGSTTRKSQLPPDTACYPDGFAALDPIDGQTPSFELDWGENLYDPVQVIDLDFALFSAIAPTRADLAWLAHVRTVNSEKKAGAASDATQDNAVVIGNRLPRPNTGCVAHLVSLEGMAKFLPADGTDQPSTTKLASGGEAKAIRLVSLRSWKFSSVDPAETFKGYLLNLEGGAGPLRHRYEEKGGDPKAVATAKYAFDLGYTAMLHATRVGGGTVSWYRGPLLPFVCSGAIVPRPSPSGAEHVDVADQVVRCDPETGMIDVSYAAGWQIGRMVALQSPSFSLALYNWKHAASHTVALAVEHQRVVTHFGHLLTAIPVPAGPGGPFALVPSRAAAEQGNADAQANLAIMYYLGNGIPKDEAEAARWFRRAAEQGLALAQANLGIMYQQGKGVAKDDAEAARWLRKAAEQGNADAQARLGFMYLDGEGVPKDEAEAARWIRKAAEQGIAAAQVNLAALYDRQSPYQGVPKDDAEAARWFRKAAEQGLAVAQYRLGVMYLNGEGVPKDDAQALRWLRKAAEQGYDVAQDTLGDVYFRGRDVRKDYAEAAAWYRKAAEQGETAAQVKLGGMYGLGQGVPKDYVQAYIWLNLAAAGGAPSSAQARDSLERLMTSEQIVEAQKRAAEWRPKIANAAPAETTPQAPSLKKPESRATSGTAFFVSKNGSALTNAHVVERCQQIRVKGDGQNGTARLLARDDKNDLALLTTDLHPAESINWRLSVRQAEDIVVYGFPLTGMLASGGNVATGNVTALAGLGNDSRFLQISAPVQPGNSGGPLLDRNGAVVGIVVAKLNALGVASATGDIPQNINFAIKASVAAAFLDAQRVAHAVSPDVGALSTPDIAERAKAFTVQVICVR
jgi:TPR repeat protein